MRFIENANLPEGKVVCMLAGGLTEKSADRLERLGITVIDPGINSAVDRRIGAHADISFLHAGGSDAFCAQSAEFYSRFPFDSIKIRRISSPLGEKYPCDCRLNCAVVGKRLICNIDTADGSVVEYFKDKGYSIVNVKQGYTKCSVLPVSANAVITDDISVYNGCKGIFDVLFVEKGFVTLGGFDYGFIGGAGGKISCGTLAFTGSIYDCRVKNEIESFCSAHNVVCEYLSDEQIYDVGSLLPITEE